MVSPDFDGPSGRRGSLVLPKVAIFGAQRWRVAVLLCSAGVGACNSSCAALRGGQIDVDGFPKTRFYVQGHLLRKSCEPRGPDLRQLGRVRKAVGEPIHEAISTRLCSALRLESKPRRASDLDHGTAAGRSKQPTTRRDRRDASRRPAVGAAPIETGQDTPTKHARRARWPTRTALSTRRTRWNY